MTVRITTIQICSLSILNCDDLSITLRLFCDFLGVFCYCKHFLEWVSSASQALFQSFCISDVSSAIANAMAKPQVRGWEVNPACHEVEM